MKKGIDDALASETPIESLDHSQGLELISSLCKQHDIKENNEDDEPNYYEHAFAILEDSLKDLICYKDVFYQFDSIKYVELTDNEIKATILRWTHRNNPSKNSNKRFQDEIFAQLKAICIVQGKAAYPFNIESEKGDIKARKAEPNKILFDNGIFDSDKYFENGPDAFSSPTPTFFCTATTGYNFEANAKEPKTFFEYLDKVQPNKEVQNLLQEWMGYCLTFDTFLERFMFFVGEGANGKSVFLLIMKLIIGGDNVSAVNLEGFKTSSRFALANTYRKKANIVGDLDEIDKVGEGVLKQFVSGEPMQVERKYKHPFTMKPTAKLTYSMNILPRLYDKSKGVWRRLLLVSWDYVIPSEERNTDYLKEKFWIETGELPRIFKWALEGLKRIRENKTFTISEELKNRKKEYERESNPARDFLLEHIEECKEDQEGCCIWSKELYAKYKEHCEEEGLRPLSSNNLTKEVKRCFPKAIKSPNALHSSIKCPMINKNNKQRDRLWTGIKFMD